MEILLNACTVGSLKEAYLAMLQKVLSHSEIVRRLDRAYDILTRDSRYTILYDAVKEIATITSPNDTYTIESGTCSCPDAELLCKHRLVLVLLLKAIRTTGERV